LLLFHPLFSHFSTLPLDLFYTNNYTVTINSSIDSDSKNNFGYIHLTTVAPNSYSSYDLYPLSYNKNCSSNGYKYNGSSYSYACYYGQSNDNTISFNLNEGKVYYLHFVYIKYGYGHGAGDLFKINSVTLTPRTTTATESTTTYEEVELEKISNFDEGNKTVVPFKESGSKLVSDNKGIPYSQI